VPRRLIRGITVLWEGQTVYMDMRNETYLQYFNRINQGIQSCMSYAGIKDINQLYSMDYSIHTNN
jgi:ABC-type Na+ transport system ATPase subunit NatA